MRTTQPGVTGAINDGGATTYEGVTEMNAGARGGIGSIPGLTNTMDGRTQAVQPHGAITM